MFTPMFDDAEMRYVVVRQEMAVWRWKCLADLEALPNGTVIVMVDRRRWLRSCRLRHHYFLTKIHFLLEHLDLFFSPET